MFLFTKGKDQLLSFWSKCCNLDGDCTVHPPNKSLLMVVLALDPTLRFELAAYRTANPHGTISLSPLHTELLVAATWYMGIPACPDMCLHGRKRHMQVVAEDRCRIK